MTTFTNEDMSNGDVSVTIETEGPEEDAESVHIHALNEIVKALEAVDERKHPEDCEGYLYNIDWDARLEE